MKNKIIFIISPIAGKGEGKIVESKVQQFFANKNIDFETYLTEYNGHATLLTQNVLLQKPTIVVACGGDGTINEVAQTLINTDIALGIIPIGSGNGLRESIASRSSTLPQANRPPRIPASSTIRALPGPSFFTGSDGES